MVLLRPVSVAELLWMTFEQHARGKTITKWGCGREVGFNPHKLQLHRVLQPAVSVVGLLHVNRCARA